MLKLTLESTKMVLKSVEVVEKLIEVFKTEGLMTSPPAGYTTVKVVNANHKTGKRGSKVESFTFGISRLCDGVVDVYHKGFIVLRWNAGTYPRNESFHSMDEVVEWANDDGWTK